MTTTDNTTVNSATATNGTNGDKPSTPPAEKAVFFTVKYGENQSKIFNAECKSDILLHHIKKKCLCSKEDTIELSDEKGRVKNIRHNKKDYGTKFIKDREVVVLLKVDPAVPDTDPRKTKFIVMLKELQENRSFIDAVNFGKLGEEGKTRRKSSSTGIDPDESNTSKSKSKTGTKKKNINRRQSSRMLIKR